MALDFFCACLQRHKRGVFITQLGQYFRLSLEPSNEPGGRWTRRGIGAVDRVQPNEAVFVFGNVEPNEVGKKTIDWQIESGPMSALGQKLTFARQNRQRKRSS